MTMGFPQGLNDYAHLCHQNAINHGFWDKMNEVLRRFPEIEPDIMASKIALIHSEGSEVLEAIRKPTAERSKKIPDFSEEADECADIFIRLMDYCGRRRMNIEGAVLAKMEYNSKRPHMHGKKL